MGDRSGVMERERSTSEILRNIIADIQEMIHSEVRLAKAELTEQAQRAGKAAGLAAGAAVMGLLAAGCIVAAATAALALIMPVWLAVLSMGVLLAAAAGALFGAARARWGQVKPVPERTVQTLKDDVTWAKHRTS